MGDSGVVGATSRELLRSGGPGCRPGHLYASVGGQPTGAAVSPGSSLVTAPWLDDATTSRPRGRTDRNGSPNRTPVRSSTWSSCEAHLSAQGPAAFPQARFPPPHVGSCGSSHHQGPAPQGPSPSLGLIDLWVDRSIGSLAVKPSVGSATKACDIAVDHCRLSFDLTLRPRVRPSHSPCPDVSAPL
jgi:hypothetical protein